MTSRIEEKLEEKLLRGAIARLRASVLAVVFGLTGGTGLFVATVWLLIRGGENVGQHLSLISNYFPGYTVTWSGSLIGFAYGTISGAIIGWSVASIYNRIATRRNPIRD
ncbi:MAG: hypothetical protein VCE43_22220 [Myxococcota bacterium]